MVMEERVRHLFGLQIETKIAMADALSDTIGKAGQRLVNCLLNDGKILIICFVNFALSFVTLSPSHNSK